MCKTNATTHVEVMERGNIFKFLSGLNHEYDIVRIQISGKEKLHPLLEAFFIRREKKVKRLSYSMKESPT